MWHARLARRLSAYGATAIKPCPMSIYHVRSGKPLVVSAYPPPMLGSSSAICGKITTSASPNSPRLA